MEKAIEEKSMENLWKIVKGSMIAIVITLVGLVIFSAILTYTKVEETIILPVILSVTSISILLGSGIMASKIKKNGILNGGVIGLLYVLVLYLVSSLVGVGFSVNLNTIFMIVISILAGMLGGIIGVNRKKK